MNIVEAVRPGITLIFERLGYKVLVANAGGIRVTLSKEGMEDQIRTFPLPRENHDLSVPLLAWRDELVGEVKK